MTDTKYVIMSRKTTSTFVHGVHHCGIHWTQAGMGEKLFNTIKEANQYIIDNRLTDVMVVGRIDIGPDLLSRDD